VTALNYILDGLEAELALERELGVLRIECDRALVGEKRATVPLPTSQPPNISTSHSNIRTFEHSNISLPNPPTSQPPNTPTPQHPFVFLHDKPLSQEGVEMMAKIITAMGTTAEEAPIIIEKPVPKARVYIVLGALALRKFQPTLKGVPGQWIETAKGAPVLVTYSPEYILRFKEVTPAVKKMKVDMWASLKSVLRRVQ